MTPTGRKMGLGAFLFITIVTIATTLDCESLYQKETEGLLNYLARVTITVPYTTNNGWNLYFVFSRNFTGIGVWDGFIRIDGPAGTADMWNNATNGNLTSGEQFSFRFRINWSEQVPATNPPVLQSLKFGDLEMCS